MVWILDVIGFRWKLHFWVREASHINAQCLVLVGEAMPYLRIVLTFREFLTGLRLSALFQSQTSFYSHIGNDDTPLKVVISTICMVVLTDSGYSKYSDPPSLSKGCYFACIRINTCYFGCLFCWGYDPSDPSNLPVHQGLGQVKNIDPSG